MSWKSAAVLATKGKKPYASIGIFRSTGGVSRLGININKALAFSLGVPLKSRANIEVGESTHEGFLRIIFNRKDGHAEVAPMGGSSSGIRVSTKTWDGLPAIFERVKITEFHWDADTKILTLALPEKLTGKKNARTVREVIGYGASS